MKQNVKKNIDEQFEIPFWKEWLDGDLLKREELVENLPIMNSIVRIGDLPETYRKTALTTLLNSFFEDLESAVYTKIRIDEEKQKKR